MADETEKRLELPKHEAFETYLGNVDLAAMDVADANKIIKGFDEWLKKEQEAQQEAQQEPKQEEPKQEEPKQEEQDKEGSDKTLGIDDNGGSEDGNPGEWQKRYYDQHKALAKEHGAKDGDISEASYSDSGVSFKIKGKDGTEGELEYNSPTSLKLKGETNIDALRAVVLNAQKEGIGSIDFSKIKDEKNKERFYMLAKAYGMDIVGLDKAPKITDEKLATMNKDEQEMFKNNNPASKDYTFWREKVSKMVEEHGKDAVLNFDGIKNKEDRARLFLATKVLGVKTRNADPENLDLKEHFSELPPVDQKRLMVLGKKEEVLAKKFDIDVKGWRDVRGELRGIHGKEIAKTKVGSQERKVAVEKRNTNLKGFNETHIERMKEKMKENSK